MKSLVIPFVAAAGLLTAPFALALDYQYVGPTDDVAQPCIDSYYGIGEAVNYTKAYGCFESLHVYQFMILMQLNGQGVPASSAKAQEIMDEWRKNNPDYTDEGLFDNDRRIAQVLKNKTIDVPVSPKLDFCKDVASHGFEWRFCSSLDNTLSEQSTNQEFAKIRARLSSNDMAIWDAVVKAFADYVQTEGHVGEDKYAGGTMAPQGWDDQQIYVRQSFLRFAQNAFVDMKLEPIGKNELAASEAAMNEAYNEAVAHNENNDDPGEDANSDPDLVETEKGYLEKAKADLAASQKTWLALQDQCTKLVVSIYAKKGNADWNLRVINALNLVRAANLKQAISD